MALLASFGAVKESPGRQEGSYSRTRAAKSAARISPAAKRAASPGVISASPADVLGRLVLALLAVCVPGSDRSSGFASERVRLLSPLLDAPPPDELPLPPPPSVHWPPSELPAPTRGWLGLYLREETMPVPPDGGASKGRCASGRLPGGESDALEKRGPYPTAARFSSAVRNVERSKRAHRASRRRWGRGTKDGTLALRYSYWPGNPVNISRRSSSPISLSWTLSSW